MYAEVLRPLDYESLVLGTKPVFYVPFQGVVQEVVKRKIATVSAVAPQICDGPFPGSVGRKFSSSTTDNDNFTIATDTSYHPAPTFSVGGWIKTGTLTDCVPLALGNTDFCILIQASNRISLNKQNGANSFITTGGYLSSPWMHLIAVRLATVSAAIYVNGVAVAGTYSNQTFVATTNDLIFGQTAGLTSDFDGALSHWAIWNRVLTQAEVTALANP